MTVETFNKDIPTIMQALPGGFLLLAVGLISYFLFYKRNAFLNKFRGAKEPKFPTSWLAILCLLQFSVGLAVHQSTALISYALEQADYLHQSKQTLHDNGFKIISSEKRYETDSFNPNSVFPKDNQVAKMVIENRGKWWDCTAKGVEGLVQFACGPDSLSIQEIKAFTDDEIKSFYEQHREKVKQYHAERSGK